jgi:hypothetical protein
MSGGVACIYTESDYNVADPRVDIAAELEQRAHLEWVWTEVKALPLRQRRALLLNLCDDPGEGVAALIPVTGLASVEGVAQLLELSVEEFRAIWDDLPLDDLAIAGLLGVSRQQVINLRRAARERLNRRIRALGVKD